MSYGVVRVPLQGRSRPLSECSGEARTERTERSVASAAAGSSAAGAGAGMHGDRGEQPDAWYSQQGAFGSRGEIVGRSQADKKAAASAFPAGLSAAGFNDSGLTASGRKGAAAAASGPTSSAPSDVSPGSGAAQGAVAQHAGSTVRASVCCAPDGMAEPAGSCGSEEAAASRLQSAAAGRPAPHASISAPEGAAGFSKLTRLKGDGQYEGALSGRGITSTYARKADGAPAAGGPALSDNAAEGSLLSAKPHSPGAEMAAKSTAMAAMQPTIAMPIPGSSPAFSAKPFASSPGAGTGPSYSALSPGTRAVVAGRTGEAGSGRLQGDAAKRALAKDSPQMRSDFVRDLLMSAFEL